eukprot:scaffold317220_cov23-Tisochrysis_lutea.AAC.1
MAFRNGTYALEGDGLEIPLVHDTLEGLRARGRGLGTDSTHFPNVASVLRAQEPIKLGMATRDYYDAPYHQWFNGVIGAIGSSTWTIAYQGGSTIVFTTEAEIRNAIDVCALPQWTKIMEHEKGSFQYLEDRLTNKCARPFWILVQRAAPNHRVAASV